MRMEPRPRTRWGKVSELWTFTRPGSGFRVPQSDRFPDLGRNLAT